MENTLLGVGVACIIAAIVGGGLKAFGMEIPLVNSNKRQLLLSLFGSVLIAWSFLQVDRPPVTDSDDSSKLGSVGPEPVQPHLSYGTWTLHDAIDEKGNNWSNSTLRFTSQEETSDGLVVRGTFTWRLDDILIGTEEFTGRYLDANRQLIFEGVAVRSASDSGSDRLAVGSYSAVVSPDERELLNGRWGATMHHEPGISGTWKATR